MNDLLRQTLSLPAPACTPDRELLAAIMRSFDGPAAALPAAASRPPHLVAIAGSQKSKVQDRK